MSVDIVNYIIVGVKISDDDLHILTTERCCKHPLPKDKSAKFCSQCGKPTFIKKRKERPEYDWQKEKLSGLDCVVDRLAINAYVGIIVAKTCANYDQEPKRFSIPDIEFTKEKIQKALEPLGLWKPNQYGYWLVLDVSY